MRPSGLVSQALDLAHGIIAANDDGVGIVDDTIADGVGQRGLADLLVPAADLKLGIEDGGSLFVTALGDLQQIAGLGVLERI